MNKSRNIKQKFIFYVMAAVILSAVLIIAIMSIGSVKSTNAVMLDNMQITARIASQSISSNLHLLAERIYNLSTEKTFTDKDVNANDRKNRLDEIKRQIEFVWLSVYDTTGQKLYGDDMAPASITDTKYYSYLTQTSNIVIGEPYYEQNVMQLCVGAPLKNGDEITGYLIGSYKYDVLNDVLSLLILGETGTAHIINEEGIIVGDSDLEIAKSGTSIYDFSSSKKSRESFEDILDHETGSGLIKLHKMSHYIGYAPIPGTNFSLMIDVPQREYMKTAQLSMILSIVFGILLIVGTGAVIVPVSDKISVSLGRATKRLQALAEGNLSDEVVQSESNDETKILTEALSETISSLNRNIQVIQSSLGALAEGDYTVEIPNNFRGDFSSIRNSLNHITDALNLTMQQMNQSSEKVNQNSGEVSNCAKRMLEGSVNQHTLLEQLQQSMGEITESIEKNKDNVIQIEQCAQNATEKAKCGADNMQGMLDTMNQIHSAVEEISQISQMIEDISDQTNLLSLNASIEAARAGEAGRGFAVVAGEIGQLSNQTSNALQQTAAIIQSSAEVIQRGLENAKQTANAFREIQEVTNQYLEISSKLAGTVNEQTASVTYMNSQLVSLKDIADDNKQLAEETNDVAASSLEQSENLKHYVESVKIRKM
ncbi:MAG: methyl-accepting chemotaxis protein [Suilimivivens sp.]